MLTFLLISGCVKTQPPETSSSISPSGTDVPEPSSSPTWPDLPVVVLNLVNLTSCSGWRASIVLPGAVVQKHLPAGYVPDFLEGNGAQVQIWGHQCPLVSVDGRDEGTTALEYVLVPIQKPAEAPPASGLRYRYLAEIGADDPVLRGWFAKWGLQPVMANLTKTFENLDVPRFKHIKGSVTLNQSQAYSFEGLVDGPDDVRANALARIFFGPDPKKDYLDHDVVAKESGAAGGNLSMAPGSAAYKLSDGMTQYPATLTSITSSYRNFLPSSPLVESE